MAKEKQKKQKAPVKHKVKTKGKKKGAKKKFYEVSAPLTAAKIHVYGSGTEELEGRIVKLDLTKSLRGKSFELKLRLKAVDDKLEGEPVSLWLVGSYVRRIVRKGTDYVEDSFIVKCRDGAVKIKPFLVTRRKVSRAVRKELRELSRKTIESYVKTRTVLELFSELTTGKLQKHLSTKLRKVYPLAVCEIRVFEIFDGEDEEGEVEEVVEGDVEEKEEGEKK